MFTDTRWPDFDRRQLWDACLEYAGRERRFGIAKDAVDSDPK
jgi:undecaprenyl diphosphate synthase